MWIPRFRDGRTGRRARPGGSLLLLLLLVLAQPAPGLPATMYTYEDDSGAVVLTDRLESVPARFRDRVQRVERDGRAGSADSGGLFSAPARSLPASRPSSSAGGGSETTLMDRFWSALPETIVPGMTQSQSVLLIGGFVLGAMALATMMLTRNPGLRFAMKWALIFVAGGTFYGIYFAEMGTNFSPRGQTVTEPRNVLDRVRTKARDIERTQQERLKGVDRLDQIGEADGEE